MLGTLRDCVPETGLTGLAAVPEASNTHTQHALVATMYRSGSVHPTRQIVSVSVFYLASQCHDPNLPLLRIASGWDILASSDRHAIA